MSGSTNSLPPAEPPAPADAARRIDAGMFALGALAFAGLLLEYGFGVSRSAATVLHTLQFAAAYLFCILQSLKLAAVPRPWRYFRRNWFEFVLVAVLAFQLVAAAGLREAPEYLYLSRHGEPAPLAAAMVVLAQLYFLAVGLVQSTWLHRALLGLRLHLALTLMASFAGLIVFGTLALKLPRAAVEGAPVSWLDALFTAASAVCVTGLTTVDVGTRFTALGQTVILALFQLGGLGILTFTAFTAVFSGEGLRGADVEKVKALLDAATLKECEWTLLRIVGMALSIEALGAALLYPFMAPHVPDPFLRVFYAVFHSVSAFCNAGFGLFADSAARFRHDPQAMAVLMGLILLGSLGYPVVWSLPRTLWRLARGRWSQVPRHARVVLGANALLLAAGTPLYYWLERDGLWAGWKPGDAWLSSLFMTVTTRTCGFATLDLARLGAPAFALTLLFMLTGGAPGSSAGGFKVTVLAAGWARLRSALAGRPPMLGGAAASAGFLERSLWVFLIVAAPFAFTAAALAAAGSAPPRQLVFEAASAAGTVGLSMGATGSLTPFGKLAVIGAMFLGRVGPATAVILWQEARRGAPKDADPVLTG